MRAGGSLVLARVHIAPSPVHTTKHDIWEPRISYAGVRHRTNTFDLHIADTCKRTNKLNKKSRQCQLRGALRQERNGERAHNICMRGMCHRPSQILCHAQDPVVNTKTTQRELEARAKRCSVKFDISLACERVPLALPGEIRARRPQTRHSQP